jgi:hypothetical protein
VSVKFSKKESQKDQKNPEKRSQQKSRKSSENHKKNQISSRPAFDPSRLSDQHAVWYARFWCQVQVIGGEILKREKN